jgi:hypothetical protein
VAIDGLGGGTFDSSPLGLGCGRHRNPAQTLDGRRPAFN